MYIKESSLQPICPFCNAELKMVYYQLISAFMGKRYIYFCSECRKVLGLSHRKGFWMG